MNGMMVVMHFLKALWLIKASAAEASEARFSPFMCSNLMPLASACPASKASKAGSPTSYPKNKKPLTGLSMAAQKSRLRGCYLWRTHKNNACSRA